LEYRARQGESIWLYADETILWRFALPRAGWWRRKAQRLRWPTRPLSPSQIKREEPLKRQAWSRYRSWSRVTSGVVLNVLGAVQYGTSKVFYKIVPHFDAQEWRPYIHQVLATCSKTTKEVVMVVDRSGIRRAHQLASTLAHWHEQFRLYVLPARCGHHLNPIEGFWRVLNVLPFFGLPSGSNRVHCDFDLNVLAYGAAFPSTLPIAKVQPSILAPGKWVDVAIREDWGGVRTSIRPSKFRRFSLATLTLPLCQNRELCFSLALVF